MSGRVGQCLWVLAWMALCVGPALGQAGGGLSVATQDRVEDPGRWPTKGDAPRSTYAGARSCTGCHRKIAATQETTPMYRAGMRADEAEELKGQARLGFREGTFETAIMNSPAGVSYTVSDGVGTVSAPAHWIFGAGKNGQTLILEKDGTYSESRLSYFTKLDALDVSPGHSAEVPDGLEKALGRRMQRGEVQLCFGCHTTEAVTAKVFDSEKAIPGVTCEACHGPGGRHVAAMHKKEFGQSPETITNPAGLSPVDSVDFCGACHRTWADVALEMPATIGVMKIRFQPYRLEMSRCWGKSGDARITCVACHDPHLPLVHEPEAYDAKCLACHASGVEAKGQRAKTVCKLATRRCVSCHMPKYELPQTHATFTDHDIRVVRENGLDRGRLSP